MSNLDQPHHFWGQYYYETVTSVVGRVKSQLTLSPGEIYK